MYRLAIACAVVVGVAAIVAAAPGPARGGAARTLEGWALYDRYCLACHGASGDGHGPAAPYTAGHPRAFTTGEYEWRSTPIGQPPTDDDLRLAIRRGVPGTSMHGFGDALSPADIDRLLPVLRAFAPTAPMKSSPLTLGALPAYAPARGAERWTQLGCVTCHGARGDGEGTSDLAARPYDLTTAPLRRPREADDRDARRRAAAMSIATGLTGTPMPGYAGAISEADLWALADHVVELGANARDDRRPLTHDAIARNRAAPYVDGTWPGRGDPAEAVVWGTLVAPQGAPPASLAPAQASLSAQQCARCHAKQAREWQGSVHSAAMSPGFRAQTFDKGPREAAACRKCHAPLAEQVAEGPLRTEGIQCAGCHVRGWTRHGPSNLAPSLLRDPSYPLTTLAIYERSDFCMPCHQLSPRHAVEGRPLLDTYREWLEGPYMARGIQCQHCHMPNREHTFRGIHDPETVRQGIALTASAHLARGTITVTVALRNIGAGHYMPTTPTPAMWLVVELVDSRGTTTGARYAHRIGRDIEYTNGAWIEHADTRIPPGAQLAIARAWTDGWTKQATHARITVEVAPDDYYTRLYEQRLATTMPAPRRVLYQDALAKARAARYVAERRLVPVR